MIALLLFLLNLLGLPFKSKGCLAAENAALRQQVIVLQRKIRGRVEFTDSERLFFIQLYRWFPSVLNAIKIIRPETLVRWHRAGFRRYWRWKSRNLGGRPRIDAALRALIRQMSIENVLWGAPRIRGELLKLGFAVAQSTVARYMARPDGRAPSGSTLGHLRTQPHAADCRHGFVRGPDAWLQSALRLGHCSAGSAGTGLDQCHQPPDGGMDCAANHRSISVG